MRKLLLTPFLFIFIGLAQAQSIQQIGWFDLQGKVEPYVNPFEDLSEDQLYNLSIYARINEMEKVMPERVTEGMKQEAENAKQQLIEQKVDINYLLKQREIIIEKRKKAAMTTNTELANKTVELGGFMLALSFDQGKVTEFLLVPTIGACSHKPVPPPNQLVLVKTKKPVQSNSPYMPVRVTGKLLITPLTKDLYLVDGQKVIDMAYSINDATVAPYIATH